MKFTHKNDNDKSIEWSSRIDASGNFVMLANGICIAYIKPNEGAFRAVVLSCEQIEGSLAGLQFGQDNQILFFVGG